MATDLKHLGIDDYDSVEEIANGVSDDLTEYLREAPGNMSSPEAVGAAGRAVVLRMFGQEEE
jgi:hypothetical protein